jgi:elongation factor G
MKMNATNNTNMRPREFALEQMRNIGIAAHIDAGKTTLTERILFHTGAIHKAGEVHDGTTTTDHMKIERDKGITITAAAIPCDWTPAREDGLEKLFAGISHRLNIIDTPGHVDFTAEVERSLRVLDGAVAVFSGVEGVQAQSETVWRQANRYAVPRIAFVNKMDRVGADFARVVKEIRARLGANAWPVLIPLLNENEVVGQLDVVNAKLLAFTGDADGRYRVEDVPTSWRALLDSARAELVNALAEIDDEIGTLFLENRAADARALKAAIRRQTIANRFVPVIGGSAYKFVGVRPLIDAVVDYLPNPAEARGWNNSTSLAALAFKVAIDRQAGRIVYVRVYSGSLSKGDFVLNSRTGKRERVGRLVRLHADKREEIASCYAGDIAAVVGAGDLSTGDTLADPEHPVTLEPPSFPEPVVSMAIEAATRADHEKLVAALVRLCDEDPTWRVFTHPETGQTIIAGMGELHLEVMRLRLEQEYHLRANAGAPQIAYRETISRSASADHLLKKQSGGAGMYARVAVEIAPRESGAGNVVENKVIGGAIPKQFVAACIKGAEEALRDGPLGGFPVVDVHVSVVDGDFHAVDSDELSFRLAAGAAVKEALRDAGPLLLEPMMNVEVNVPLEYQGDILGDLNRRRGKVSGVSMEQGAAVIKAVVPLVDMFGYANSIRSLSKGRAAYSMEMWRFERVPSGKVDELLKKS